MDRMEEALKAACWIIDILPKRVPRLSPGQYRAVEQYYLKEPSIREKKVNLLLKLNCYYDFELQQENRQIHNPAPEMLAGLVGREYLNILVGQALIVVDHTDTYMTVFNADDELMALIRQLADSEGLFVWEGAVL